LFIELPWISSSLHAHAKGHWRDKSGATRAARNAAKAIAADGMARKSLKRIETPASVVYRFYVPDLRKRDAANMIQSCKPYIDGIVDAGLLAGDDWQRLAIAGVVVEVDRLKPRVVLELN